MSPDLFFPRKFRLITGLTNSVQTAFAATAATASATIPPPSYLRRAYITEEAGAAEIVTFRKVDDTVLFSVPVGANACVVVDLDFFCADGIELICATAATVRVLITYF